jgi:glycerol kinase
MAGDQLLIIDEGTTSTRATLVDGGGRRLGIAQHELTCRFPQPGWVEQDANQIWALTLAAARSVIAEASGADGIAAIGISNQRETIVFWDRATGEPLGPAIVWQDRRTAGLCAELEDHEPLMQQRTGLLLDPYFSATKIRWALGEWPALREAGDRLCIGTIDSWLIFKLTGGLHVTDATNASRTALMDLERGWDDELLELFRVPRPALPEIVDSAGQLGEALPEHFGAAIPICGIAGDQQAAAIGQACFNPGDTKATYGTGAFILTHAGAPPPRSANRLLGTVAWQIGGERRYALEGSLFVAGRMIQWLRDDFGLVATSEESEALAGSVESSGGVTIVPAFAGLGAPHWKPHARGAILGLSLGTGRAEIVRAALEAIGNQTVELQRAFAADGVDWSRLRIDGGMAANTLFAQDLADVLGLTVERPADVETSTRGAAMLAAVGAGLFRSLEAAAEAARPVFETFAPRMNAGAREQRRAEWDKTVAAVIELGG